jgi:uncharacterized membrane protein
MKLRAGETLVYKTRPHWIVFAWAVWLASLAARFFFAANHVSSADNAQMWVGLAWTFSVVAVIAAILAQFYRWRVRASFSPIGGLFFSSGITKIRKNSQKNLDMYCQQCYRYWRCYMKGYRNQARMQWSFRRPRAFGRLSKAPDA